MLDALIVGGDSQIGCELVGRLKAAGLDVVSTSKRWPPTEGRIPFNLEYPCLLPEAGSYIFATGINGFKPCEAAPAEAHRVNVKLLLETAKKIVYSWGGHLIYLSSSAAETHPNTVYGTTKREAEFGFQEMGAAIYRFGPVAFPGRRVYPNEVYSPIGTGTLCAILHSAIDDFHPGLHRITNRDWEPEVKQPTLDIGESASWTENTITAAT